METEGGLVVGLMLAGQKVFFFLCILFNLFIYSFYLHYFAKELGGQPVIGWLANWQGQWTHPRLSAWYLSCDREIKLSFIGSLIQGGSRMLYLLVVSTDYVVVQSGPIIPIYPVWNLVFLELLLSCPWQIVHHLYRFAETSGKQQGSTLQTCCSKDQ